MDELVKVLVNLLEFLVLGAMPLVLFMTACWDKPAGRFLRGHYTHIFHRERTLSQSHVLESFAVFSLLAMMWFLGVLLNSTAYWFFQPDHVRIVSAAEREYRDSQAGKLTELTPGPGFYLLPRLAPNPSEYRDYYENDRKLAGLDKDSVSALLNPVVKVEVLIRGAILMLPLFALMLLYRAWGSGQSRKTGFLTVIFVSAILYFVLMECFWTEEMDFHKTVCLMASTTAPPASHQAVFIVTNAPPASMTNLAEVLIVSPK